MKTESYFQFFPSYPLPTFLEPTLSPHASWLLVWNKELSPLLTLIVSLSSDQKYCRTEGRDLNSFIVIPRAFYRCLLTILFGAHREAGNLETWRKKTSSKKTHKRIWRGGGGQLLKWQRQCKKRERMKECFFVTLWLFKAPSKRLYDPSPSQHICCSVTQPCPTLCDPMDYSSPGFPFCLHPSNWLTSLLSVQRHFWDIYHYFPW